VSAPAVPAVAPLSQEEEELNLDLSALDAPDSALDDLPMRSVPHVLVVEDDADTRRLLAFQLQERGFRVTTAADGREALALAERQHPDLVTLDVLMPGMDGFETLAALKQNALTLDIPVVMLSVVPEQAKGFALGASDYLSKPPDPAQLMQSIRAVLEIDDRAAGDDGAGPGSARLRVLVVDDEADLVAWLQTVLHDHGIEVLPAYGGREALEKARTQHPDVIVMDVKMPDMTGLEVSQALKADPATAPIPVIFMTASDIDKRQARTRMLGLGAVELLGKPFSAEDLVSEILRQTMILQVAVPAGQGEPATDGAPHAGEATS
jgi:CheY-like chemotaxis protein